MPGRNASGMATWRNASEVASLTERPVMVGRGTGARPIEPAVLRQIDPDNDFRGQRAPLSPYPRPSTPFAIGIDPLWRMGT